MIETYSNITIGGVEMGSVASVDYEPDVDAIEAAALSDLCAELGVPRHIIATATFEMPGESLDRLLCALIPPVRGATDAVLARRVTYGGRKGRAAWRRLCARGYNAVARVEGVMMPARVEGRRVGK